MSTTLWRRRWSFVALAIAWLISAPIELFLYALLVEHALANSVTHAVAVAAFIAIPLGVLAFSWRQVRALGNPERRSGDRRMESRRHDVPR